jgi:hypothetical protein
MDPTASVAVVLAAGSGPKKQSKVRELAKEMTSDERRIESEKRAGRHEAVKEHRKETKWFLATQAFANSKDWLVKPSCAWSC